jgi:hypothetical protein
MKFVKIFFVIMAVFAGSNFSVTFATEWTDISGEVTAEDGTPLCTMVLANGQYMFSCDPMGEYALSVPLDENGQITLFAFCDGLAPFKEILTPEQSANFDIAMSPVSPNSERMTVTAEFDVAVTHSGWIKIAGTVRNNDNIPLCTMVLANGQHSFTCGENQGKYEIEVPVDEEKKVTIFTFCDGFQPSKHIFDTTEIDIDGDGYTEKEGDCDANNADKYPGNIEICSDGIDQDCNGSDLPCFCPGDTIGFLTMQGSTNGVFVSGDYAYVLNENNLWIVDVTSKVNPSTVGSVALSDTSESICVSDSYAYVGTYDERLYVINIDNHSMPVVVSSISLPDGAEDIDINDNYVYIAAQREGLQIVDISNPNAPVIVSSVGVPERAENLFLLSPYCYMAARGVLQIIDVSNPNNPTIVNSISALYSVQDVYVSGSKAYIVGATDSANNGGGGVVKIYDIGDPQNPAELGDLNTDSFVTYGVKFSNNYVYMNDVYISADRRTLTESHIKVVDTNDPSNLIIEGTINTPGLVSAVRGTYIYDSFLYACDIENGLYIVDISGCN